MELDIKKMTAKAHGYVGNSGLSLSGPSSDIAADVNDLGADLRTGSPYFMRLKLRTASGREYELPNEPLVTVRHKHTIVETATVGKQRRGTVKEYITAEDYELRIKGLCLGEGKYPTEEVRTVIALGNETEPLEVVGSRFLELFGIRRIVIKDKDYDEMAGIPWSQKYEITAVSDEEFYADLEQKRQVLG